VTDSNRRPSRCKRDALPAELTARDRTFMERQVVAYWVSSVNSVAGCRSSCGDACALPPRSADMIQLFWPVWLQKFLATAIQNFALAWAASFAFGR
jgi:hypothetical protein